MLQLEGLPEERQMVHPPRSIFRHGRVHSYPPAEPTCRVGTPKAMPLSFKMITHRGVPFHRRVLLSLKTGSKRCPSLPLVEIRACQLSSFSRALTAAELLIGLDNLDCKDGDLIDSSESFMLQFS